jgi:FkbM family methyltransferase
LRSIVRGAARLWFRARGKVATRIRGDRYWTDPYHLGFWRDVERGRWEPDLFDVLEKHLRPDGVYADVGAWIGPTVLFAARRCRKVACFEPDPEAYQYLLWNLRLNGIRNVTPFQVALAAEAGIRRIASPVGGLGDSKATLLPTPGAGGGADVPCLRWSEWVSLPGVERPDFIKVDIEGGEFELIPSMAEYLRRERPTLHLSLHAPLLPEAERAKSLAVLLDAVRHFKTCIREDGSPIGMEELGRVAMTRFCSVLLTDGARDA